jgi:hypothetical protein
MIMKINYNVQGKARGKLVKIIAEALNQEATYLKAPTYNYEIGAFTITREGELEFDIADVTKEEIQTAVDAAKAAGFEVVEIDGEPAHETETTLEEEGEDYPETAAEIEPQAEDDEPAEDEDNGEISEDFEEGIFTIIYPHGGFTPQTLDNLEKMVIAKGELIKAALGAENLPIEIDGEEVKFPWFGKCNHADMMAYAQFIERLCKTAQAKTRVTATAPESFDNEKFSMRVWLISLGCKGEEFAFLRKRLMRDLSGNSGFRYEDKQPRNPRSGERVEKQVLSVRFTPEMLDKIAELAGQSGMSRNGFIESVVCEYVQAELPETETSDIEDSE